MGGQGKWLWPTIKLLTPDVLRCVIYLSAMLAVITFRLPMWFEVIMLAALTLGLVVNGMSLRRRIVFAYRMARVIIAGRKMYKEMEKFFGKGNVTFGYKFEPKQDYPPPAGVQLGEGDIEDYIEEYVDTDGVTKTRWKYMSKE